MYFYSHLLAQRNPDKSHEGTLTRKIMFLDCLPSKYVSIFSPENPPEDWSVTVLTGSARIQSARKGDTGRCHRRLILRRMIR
jgi:hypothetical protein